MLREHTRYLQRATEWDSGGRPANRLLSGADIELANAWAARRPKEAPAPTALHLDFIRASEEAERRRLAEIEAAKDEREKLLLKLQAETDRADQFVQLVSSNPAGLRAMKKICLEAIEVTSTLYTTIVPTELVVSRDRFWELYFGPMYIVELHQRKNVGEGSSKIETAMVRFGQRLQEAESRGEPLPRSSLSDLALAVRDECITYLGN